ncbi:MAG: trimethylamine methyltransferase family protein [Anaerolineae bacterium]|jgi:hypothetical protein
MIQNYSPEAIVALVHEKTVEILSEVGFCVPEKEALARLEAAGFPVEWASQMVRVTPELLEASLESLPQDVKLYDRAGKEVVPFERSCFMGAGTPVNVFDLHTDQQRPATRQDVRDLVRLQDALPQVDIVRPTVTATDQGECSDLVEIAELGMAMGGASAGGDQRRHSRVLLRRGWPRRPRGRHYGPGQRGQDGRRAHSGRDPSDMR